ncbi:MAG: hypothetical protein C0412_01160 [Flavobacterium sp.]|nr:hypothetical protein [Flavobacterium sp.]
MKKQIYCLFVLLFLSEYTFPQNKTIDSLEAVLRDRTEENIRIDALSKLVYNLIIIGKIEKAEETVIIYEDFGKKNNNLKIEAGALNYKGLISFYRGNFEQAKLNCASALALYRAENDIGGLANVNGNLGMFYLREDDFYKALEYMTESLKYFEKLNNKKKLLVTYNNVGNLHAQMGNFEMSFTYFNSALKIANELKDKNIIPYIYNSLGNYYSTKQKYQEALIYYEKSIQACEEVNNKLVLGMAYYNTSFTYKAYNNYKKSMEYLQKSLQMRKETGDSMGLIQSFNHIGLLNLELKNFEKSKECLKKAMELNKLKKSNPELKESYLLNSRLDSALGNYIGAYNWYKRYSDINERMLNESKSKSIGKLEAKYEYEKKEEQLIAFQKGKDLENKTKIIKQSYLIYSLTGVFLLMLIILAFACNAKKNKQRVNETLISMVDEKTKELRAAKEKAEASEKIKEDFLSQMSHEIRTPLNNVINLAGVLNNEIKELKEEEILDIVKGINKSGGRIIRTIEMILNYAEVTNGTYVPKKEHIKLAKICHEVIAEVKPLMNELGLAVKIHNYIGEKNIDADEYSIKQVIKNIVENAIIYTEEGNIDITLEETEGNIVFNCRDTGIGMSDEYKIKVFEPFSQEEMGYTRKYEGNGLGLALAKRFCDINDASIICESEKGVGTLLKVIFN